MKKMNFLLALAAVGLFVAILDMSNQYYNLLEWYVMVVAIFSAYLAHKQKQIPLMVVFIVMAVILNPILDFNFHKSTWNMIDAISGAVCLLGAFVIKLK
jgi:uncharacterized membrane protein